jgi:hypothetical protein
MLFTEIMSEKEPIIPTLEGVQLCLQNSERLFQDSGKVTNETCADLIELSLEEIAKAW